MDGTCNATGAAGTTHLRDSQGRNHLQFQGTAAPWQATGVLALQFPTNGASAVSKSVTLKVAGGLSSLGSNPTRPLLYYMQIDENNTFDSAALKTSGWLPQYGTWKPRLKPSTKYYWRVQVKDSSSTPLTSTFAATNSFTTKAASTWYVRPGVYAEFDSNTGTPLPTAGVYGLQTGTSYDNAWNGIFSIVWGEGGVEPGDTVYLCGTHCYTASNNNNVGDQALTYISESGFSTNYPITIRMDYPSDPGVMWGAARINLNGGGTWSGPDANGVYSCANLQYSADY